jgi:hypothetical protein
MLADSVFMERNESSELVMWQNVREALSEYLGSSVGTKTESSAGEMQTNSVEPVGNKQLTAGKLDSVALKMDMKNSILEWNAAQVERWFKDNEIDMAFLNDMQPCDGKILNQM